MSGPDLNSDQGVDDLLAGRSELSRRYRAGSSAEQPPAALDQRVLAQAAAAVGHRVKVAPLPARSRARWMVPFAVAATVLLSFAIFREVGVGTGVSVREEAAPATQPAPAEAPQAQTQFMEDGPAATDGQAAEAESAESPRGLADAAPPAAPMPPVTTPPVALQPPEVTVAVSQAPATNGVQGRVVQRSPAPAAGPGAEAAMRQGAATPPVSADDWLRDIRVLREAGRHEEADAALQDFLKAYPDYFERNPGVVRP